MDMYNEIYMEVIESVSEKLGSGWGLEKLIQ